MSAREQLPEIWKEYRGHTKVRGIIVGSLALQCASASGGYLHCLLRATSTSSLLLPQRFKDVPRLLLRIKTVKSTPGDWFHLQHSIISANM